MKRTISTVIVLVYALFLLSIPAFAQGKKPAFVGVVTQVDPAGKTIAVKAGAALVTFDASNPVFRGYKSLEQVKKGDRIAVSYTAEGVRIARAGAAEREQAREAARPAPEAAKPQSQATRTAKINRARPLRVRERSNSVEFNDVDNNGDGKISPVELGAVLPDLTVERFKTYDRNGDGSLSNSEYNVVKKTLPNGH